MRNRVYTGPGKKGRTEPQRVSSGGVTLAGPRVLLWDGHQTSHSLS